MTGPVRIGVVITVTIVILEQIVQIVEEVLVEEVLVEEVQQVVVPVEVV